MHHTVCNYARIPVLDHLEHPRPFGEVIEVETDVVVLCQGVQVRQVHLQQVRRDRTADGGHVGGAWSMMEGRMWG